MQTRHCRWAIDGPAPPLTAAGCKQARATLMFAPFCAWGANSYCCLATVARAFGALPR